MMKTKCKLLAIRFWLKYRRCTGLVLWFCRNTTIKGPGGEITVQFEDYRDFKTFREVFFEEQYQLPINPDNVEMIVDLGANVGYATAYFFLKYPNAKILAVEPGPQVFKRLAAVAAGQERVVTRQIAISDSDGMTRLHLVGDASASSSLMVRKDETQTVQVETQTLSTLLKNIPEVDILKTDIEGSEQYVLQDPAIHKVKNIIGEIHPDLITVPVETLLRSLVDFDYVVKKITEGRLILTAQKNTSDRNSGFDPRR